MKPIKKVILIQLPEPQFRLQKQWGNSPLAAGYLKAEAFQAGLLDLVDIEILGDYEASLLGDAGLVDRIVSKSPDMVGWSMYSWNAGRSLHLSSEIKERRPQTRILVGGPEVTPNTHYILHHPAVDMGCFGEGEAAFIGILNALLNDDTSLSDLPGIFHKVDGTLHITESSKNLHNLKQSPSPFRLGYIDIRKYTMISYETLRGCPNHCAYCHTATVPFRPFPVERICSDIQYFIENGVRQVRFVDSDLSLHPRFTELFTRIGRINAGGSICFAGFSYAEHLTEDKVRLMRACGIGFLQTGLQTIHARTLKTIRRPGLDREAFVRGIRLLEEYGIAYTVDTIVGLPGESFDDFLATIDFLRSNNIGTFNVFPLMVMPGTLLSRMAAELGIRHDPKPPYYLIETDAINEKQILEASSLKTSIGKDDFEPFVYTTHLTGTLFGIDSPSLREKGVTPYSTGIHKLVMDLDDHPDAMELFARHHMAERINYPFTVWFRSNRIHEHLNDIIALLRGAVARNPFLLMRIIVETDVFISLEELNPRILFPEALERYVKLDPKKSYPIETFFVFRWHRRETMSKPLRSQIREMTNAAWAVTISQASDWKSKLKAIRGFSPVNGIVIDFDNKSHPLFIIDVLKHMLEEPMERIYFRSLAVSTVMTFMKEIARSALREPSDKIFFDLPHIETIMTIGRDGEAQITLSPGPQTSLVLAALQVKVGRLLNEFSNGAVMYDR